MAITLSITDNGDGTGTATIAGSTGTNTLYKATWTGIGNVQLSWTSVGSRSGDGTIAISGEGFFLFRLENSVDGFSAAVYQPITDTTAKSLVKQLMEAVGTTIRSLSLTGISSVNVLEQWMPRVLRDVEASSLPKVFVCPWDRLSFPGILTGKDDIGVPIVVVFVAAQNQDQTTNISRNTDWTWKTLSAFRYQQISGISSFYGVYNCIPEVDVQVNPDWFMTGLYVSAFVLRFITRSPRGLI